MLDMCKYNEASQHDSTTQVLYLGLREPYITYTQRYGSYDPTYKSKHKRKLSCLSTDIYKWKRLRSLTIYQILPRAQDRS